MNHKRYAIGVDVGGSHVSCKTYDLQENKLLKETTNSLPIDNRESKESIISCFVELIKLNRANIENEAFAGIGIAMPGPFDYVNGIGLFSGDNVKFVNLFQVNIRKELSEKLKVKEEDIRFINDAAAFALGEYVNGSLKGYNKCLAITLGTGFGAAFLSKGIPVLSGEEVPRSGYLWNLPFEDGIADEYFSTRGLVNRFEFTSQLKVNGVKDIAELYNENIYASSVFNDFGEKLAAFLSPWIKSFGVNALIIGGNISRAISLFINPMNKALKAEGLQIKIGASELREDAAFIGSGILLDDTFYSAIKEQLKYM